MTIEQAEQEFIQAFNSLEDWLMQYEYLLELAGAAPAPAEEEKNEDTRLKGCQSNAWVVLGDDGARLHIAVDSDALIIRGILGVFSLLLQDRTLEEGAAARLTFLEATALHEQLSTDRFSAMTGVAGQIRSYCARRLAELGRPVPAE